jgi:hypothetical protein
MLANQFYKGTLSVSGDRKVYYKTTTVFLCKIDLRSFVKLIGNETHQTLTTKKMVVMSSRKWKNKLRCTCPQVRRNQSLVDLKSYYYIRGITTTNTCYKIKKQTSQNVSSDSKDPILGTFTCWSITTSNTYYQKNVFFCFANIWFRIILVCIFSQVFSYMSIIWLFSTVERGLHSIWPVAFETQHRLYAQFSYTRAFK